MMGQAYKNASHLSIILPEQGDRLKESNSCANSQTVHVPVNSPIRHNIIPGPEITGTNRVHRNLTWVSRPFLSSAGFPTWPGT